MMTIVSSLNDSLEAITLVNIFKKAAAEKPEAIALRCEDGNGWKQWTYKQYTCLCTCLMSMNMCMRMCMCMSIHTAHGALRTAHGAWCMAQGLWLKAYGSRPMAYGSRL